jgi:phage terminase small subunit
MASGGARRGAGRPRGIQTKWRTTRDREAADLPGHAEVQARVTEPGDANGQLRPRQARFVREYLLDRNGTQAAIRAGYSAKTAYGIASQLLRKLKVRQQIAEAEDAYLAKLDVSAAKIRARLVIIGFGDVGDLFDAQGLLKPMTELTPEQRALIASIDVMEETEHRGRVIKVRLRDQIRALELLARHKAMFPKEEPPPANMQVATVVKIVHQHFPGPSKTSWVVRRRRRGQGCHAHGRQRPCERLSSRQTARSSTTLQRGVATGGRRGRVDGREKALRESRPDAPRVDLVSLVK